MAAVLACGCAPGARKVLVDASTSVAGKKAGGEGSSAVLDHWRAAVSHRSAAVLWELLPAIDGPIDISVPCHAGRKRRQGIWIHRSRSLLPAAVTLRRDIPVTTPARTIADLRRAARDARHPVAEKDLRRAIRQAGVFGLSIGDEVERDRTRSELEHAFLRLCRLHGLPTPEVNVRVASHLVDFLWRERRLIVETDGYRYHRGRRAFEDDRARDLSLRELGYDVVRLSARQVASDPSRAVAVLAEALGGPNSIPPP